MSAFFFFEVEKNRKKKSKQKKLSLSPFGFRLQLARSLLHPGHGRVHPSPRRRGLALQLRLGALRQVGRGPLDLLLGPGDGRGGPVRRVVDALRRAARRGGDGLGRLVCRGGDLRRGLAVLCCFFCVCAYVSGREGERESE